MRTHSTPAFRRKALAVPAVAPRAPSRATLIRPHARSEKVIAIAGAAFAAVLVLAGAAYTMTRYSAPPPRREAVVHPFVQGRIARIVIPDNDGVCQMHSFDNDRGVFGASRAVPCAESQPQGSRVSKEDFSNFKSAFGGR